MAKQGGKVPAAHVPSVTDLLEYLQSYRRQRLERIRTQAVGFRTVPRGQTKEQRHLDEIERPQRWQRWAERIHKALDAEAALIDAAVQQAQHTGDSITHSRRAVLRSNKRLGQSYLKAWDAFPDWAPVDREELALETEIIAQRALQATAIHHMQAFDAMAEDRYRAILTWNNHSDARRSGAQKANESKNERRSSRHAALLKQFKTLVEEGLEELCSERTATSRAYQTLRRQENVTVRHMHAIIREAKAEERPKGGSH